MRLLKTAFHLWLTLGTFALQTHLAKADTLVPAGATWRYLRGTAEASTPDPTLWRARTFDDASWLSGAMPFWYGDVLPGGTELTGMVNVHSTIFLRQSFSVTSPLDIGGLILTAKCDDGFIAWINGVEVYRYNVSVISPTYQSNAAISVPEPPPVNNFNLPDPRNYLVSGTNVLAVMGFNSSLGSGDFGLDLSLATTGPDATVPTIISIDPAPGPVSVLSQIAVTFSEPVRGITADDLIMNQTAATAVTGAGATWTFTFAEPPTGEVLVSFSAAHNISDVATPAHPFDHSVPNASWRYDYVDIAPPVVAQLNPPGGATVRALTQVEVVFSEPVLGVEAADLLIDDFPATGVSNPAPNKYVFTFPARAPGVSHLVWAAAHAIRDKASPSNAFTGGSWSYTVDPNAALNGPRINEFLTANISATGLKDEDNELQDWLEIYNASGAPVSLAGWSLTDDAEDPGRWIFPNVTIGAQQFLVIFLSGKDRRPTTPGSKLHTNFKLNPGGEFLAFYNAESPRGAVTQFAPQYPEQRNDFSYGIDDNAVWRFFAAPTPNAPNGNSTLSGVTARPRFNSAHGFFDAPFDLHLSTETAGATIRYTLDGRVPTTTVGQIYAGPLHITTTGIVRAVAFAPGALPSNVATQSYIFPGAVRTQNGAGFPVTWSNGSTSVAADYEVDPTVVNNAAYNATFTNDLLAIPSMSIVMNQADMFGTTGLYTNSQQSGAAWERPCSIEMIYPDARAGFQQDCGLRIQGGFGRSPSIKKHSFRPLFKGDYGASKLNFPLFPGSPVEEFDTIVLRAGMNNSYVLSTGEASRATFTEDEWMRQTQRAMGQPSGYGNFVHLYINGLYWGLYNPTERPSAPFAASHLGGEKEAWDALNSSEAIDGTKVAWTTLQNLCNAGVTTDAQYQQVQQYLDVDNLIDYMLLNFYGGNADWDDHNWYAARRRQPSAGYKFFSWDGERTLESPSGADKTGVNQADKPSRIYAALRGIFPAGTVPGVANTEFKMRFADRAHRHLFNDGSLSPNVARARWQSVEAMLDRAVVGESARWGDTLREPPYTRNVEFQNEVNRKNNTQFPQRTSNLLTQLRNIGLYPTVTAPGFNQHGGRAPANFSLTITAPAGQIYYTLNGADPRRYGTGEIAPDAMLYTAPVVLNNSLVIKARVFNGGIWSALNEAEFKVAQLGVPLRITELMYNPVGGDAFEFVEFQNIGRTTLDLSGMRVSGIDFVFAPNTLLAAGARIVIGSNLSPAQFASRYPGITVAGTFNGALANGGERIALEDRDGSTICVVHFDDGGAWPPAADGTGHSLEIIDPTADPDDPANWEASSVINGSPGSANAPRPAIGVVLHEVLAENGGAVVRDLSTPDYIELANTTAMAIDVGGWRLTDGVSTYIIPAATTIGADGFLVVWCDGAGGGGGLHAGFEISSRGATIALFDAANTRVDAVTFGSQVVDRSIGRVNGAWTLTIPSPAAANVAAPVGAPNNLIVNEWLLRPETNESAWIELHNRDVALPVALQGIWVQAGSAFAQVRCMSFIAPGGFARFFADQNPGVDHLDLALPAGNSSFVLSDATATSISTVAVGVQSIDVAQGLLPDGSATTVAFPISASPGRSNYLPPATRPIFNEILVRNDGVTPALDGHWVGWVELTNPSATAALDLTGMRIRVEADTSTDWLFPSGTTLAPNGFILLWCDPAHPASIEPGVTPLQIGHALPLNSGKLTLLDANERVLDAVEYGPQIPNLSFGRTSGDAWRLLAAPTPSAANAVPATMGSVSALRINEWIAAPQIGDDWIELFNPGALPLDLSGCFLTDDASIAGKQSAQGLKPNSYIGANGYAVLVADDRAGMGADHLSFKLANEGDALRLYSATAQLIDAADFGAALAGISTGRYPENGSSIIQFTATASPGAMNYIDTDSDRLPDAWEIANGLSTNVADALLDLDADGQTNLEEFIAGTDPRDSKSVLSVVATRGPVGETRVSFAAQPTRTYTSEFNDTLAPDAWRKLSDIAAASTAHLVEIVDPAPASGARFYRLVTPRVP